MRTRSALRAVLAAAALLAAAGAAWAGQVESGKNGIGTLITAKSFDTYVIRAGARPPGEKAAVGLQLFEGDTVVTKEMGGADILLDDGSLLRLRENTNLVLKDKKPGKSKGRLQVLLGRIWAKVTTRENLLEIETPSAVAAVKGTALELIVLQNGDSTLIVWDGLVEFMNELGKVMVKAAQESQAQKGQAPGQPVNVDLNKLEQWFKASIGTPPIRTLKTTVKDKNGREQQINLKYDKK
jgi:hypothetical protein